MNLARSVLEAARARGLRLALAESCTGGLIAAALTDIPGSSDVVECGFVTYSNDSKARLLGVSRKSLARFGAVSREVAEAMAAGALARTGAGISVAVTGIAGPGGGSRGKPEGRVWFALADARGNVTAQLRDFGAPGRREVRALARDHALAMLLGAITAHSPTGQDEQGD